MNVIVRDQIVKLEEALSQFPQLHIPVRHYFAEGLYCREILIPKGTILTGRIHLYSHVNIVSLGEISVTTDKEALRIKAPYTFIAGPGTKRAGYAHEDTIWTTVHACREMEAQRAEQTLTVGSFEEYQACLSSALQ